MRKVIFTIIFCLFFVCRVHAEVVVRVRVVNPLNTEAVAPIKYPLPAGITPDDVLAQRMVHAGRTLGLQGFTTEDKKERKSTKNIIPPELKKTETLPKNTDAEVDPQEQPKGADILYNEKDNLYYIDHEMLLAPKDVVTLEIVLRDIWIISDKTIESFKRQLKTISKEIKKDNTTGLALRKEIDRQLDDIRQHQAKNTTTNSSVENHIKAYETNKKTLSQIKFDIGMLQGLLLEANAQ